MNPFTKINAFVESVIGDVFNLALSVAVLGFIVCGLMIWRGSEESVPRFQKGLLWTGVSVAVIVLAKVIVGWIRAGVA